jgi:putative hydrolase of HD superfamily
MNEKSIADLLHEACFLKRLPRSGYAFLGRGNESVAEHSFSVTFIAFVMAQLNPEADALRLISLALVHDLPESRMGDINYFQRLYTTADENSAVADMVADIPFGTLLSGLIGEFNDQHTLESRLAHDADQLALILDLKPIDESGYEPVRDWLSTACDRLKTSTGKTLARSILDRDSHRWWHKNLIDSSGRIK